MSHVNLEREIRRLEKALTQAPASDRLFVREKLERLIPTLPKARNVVAPRPLVSDIDEDLFDNMPV